MYKKVQLSEHIEAIFAGDLLGLFLSKCKQDSVPIVGELSFVLYLSWGKGNGKDHQ